MGWGQSKVWYELARWRNFIFESKQEVWENVSFLTKLDLLVKKNGYKEKRQKTTAATYFDMPWLNSPFCFFLFLFLFKVQKSRRAAFNRALFIRLEKQKRVVENTKQIIIQGQWFPTRVPWASARGAASSNSLIAIPITLVRGAANYLQFLVRVPQIKKGWKTLYSDLNYGTIVL